MTEQKYRYKNCPIPGGGYATGFQYHPKEEGVLYLRTDIGGTYRYEAKSQTWHSLIDHVNMQDLRETFPIAVALDPEDPSALYIASGIWQQPPGRFSVSHDYGETFTYQDMPFRVHGNMNGRGTGYRMVVDGSTIYYASQADGLWKTEDEGKTWEKLGGMKEDYLTFVALVGSALVVATAGVTTKRSESLRGHSLYVSYDRGETFEELWMPMDGEIPGIRLAGLVGQRYSSTEEYLYVTCSVMGFNAYVLELGYSCDGGSVVGGKVIRYPIHEDGRIGQGEDITPNPLLTLGLPYGEKGESPMDSGNSLGEKERILSQLPYEVLPYGFSGLATTGQQPGLVVVSSISKEDGDIILRSEDYGETWECILYDLAVGRMAFRTEYMTPQYNGGHNLIHWLTDLKINPFYANEMWFNTGTGVFRTDNLLDEKVVFSDHSDGIEETVHLNLYSPAKGEVRLIDILGDLGGFAFRDIDRPCANSFADSHGNRYITCINADYSEENPKLVIVTPRGNWTGKTKGGLILTTDGCKTFRRLPMPWGLSGKIDDALHLIEHPNVNSGWVAMSQDAAHIVWSIADRIDLPMDMVVASHDGGETFSRIFVYGLDGQLLSDAEIQERGLGFKAFSDRKNPGRFYGFGEKGQVYLSTDGGRSFHELETPKDWPKTKFTLIDCANKTEVRGEAGRTGVFYAALREDGLWKLTIQDSFRATRLTKEGDLVYRMGLGLGRAGGDYERDPKAIYIAAELDGDYGFYRTEDEGASFIRLNTDRQMFGEVNSMEGDSRTYGRFYIATGSRGVLYGEPDR